MSQRQAAGGLLRGKSSGSPSCLFACLGGDPTHPEHGDGDLNRIRVWISWPRCIAIDARVRSLCVWCFFYMVVSGWAQSVRTGGGITSCRRVGQGPAPLQPGATGGTATDR